MPGAARRPRGQEMYRGARVEAMDCFAHEEFGIWECVSESYRGAQKPSFCLSKPMAWLSLRRTGCSVFDSARGEARTFRESADESDFCNNCARCPLSTTRRISRLNLFVGVASSHFQGCSGVASGFHSQLPLCQSCAANPIQESWV